VRSRQASYPLIVTESLAQSPAPRVRRSRCRASLTLHNPGDEHVLIRSADVCDVDGLRGVRGQVFSVRVPAMLRPSASSRVPIDFDIPRTARPGSYKFEVTVGGITEVMEIEVSPRMGLRLSPPEIVVTKPGSSLHSIRIENVGNVDVSVTGSIAVPLDDELIMCRSLRGGLALFDEADEAEITFDRLFARVAKTAHSALSGAIVGVRFLPQFDPIPPGGTSPVTVEIDTPTSLDPRTRYVAIIPVLTATLSVVVVPTKVGFISAAVRDPARNKATKRTTSRK
jgi:hypothetical protein